ncbi:MAG: hypothetical protein P1P84_19720 [Deferrisomatales bacterium]|nr:hypothetical protein [Deferrisomatales bacterium]
MKPTATRQRKPSSPTAPWSCPAQAAREACNRSRPVAASQKVPGSAALGSTSGLKRRSRSVSCSTPWRISGAGISPACSVRARDRAAA